MSDKHEFLIDAWPYHPYRNYRLINKSQQNLITRSLLSKADLSDTQWVVEQKAQEKVAALAILTKLNWDTDHFGIRMGSIDHVISQTNIDFNEDFAQKNLLVGSCIEKAKCLEIEHLTCKIDASDSAAIMAAQANGFVLADTLLTMLCRKKSKPRETKVIYNIRDARNDDLDEMYDIAKMSFTSSRFHRDPHIPNDAADELYKVWIDIYLKQHTLIVTETKNAINGFMASRVDEELRDLTGIEIMGRGLSGVSPYAKGAYPQFVRDAMSRVERLHHGAEFDGSLSNQEVLDIWIRLGLSWVRSKYIFHLWMG